jgi:8-oxo-dGTP diphosphatase
MKQAIRTSWKTEPLPSKHAILTVDCSFTESEMEKVRMGLIPREMENKWFIFFEDDILYMHRSWTGFCMYVAHIAKSDNHYIVTKLLVNRDDTQYKNTDDDLDVEEFQRIINNFISGMYSYPER